MNEGYMRLCLYVILDAVKLAQKGSKRELAWLESDEVEKWINTAGLKGKLKVVTVRNLLGKDRIKKRLECLMLQKDFVEEL